MSGRPAFLLFIPLLILLLVLFLSDIPGAPPFVYKAASVMCAAGALLGVLRPELCLLLLGASICLLPMFGAGVLSAFTAASLAGLECRRFFFPAAGVRREASTNSKFLLLGFLFLLLSLLLAAVSSFLIQSDPALWRTILSAGGLKGLLRYTAGGFAQWKALPIAFGGWLLAALLAFSLYFEERQSGRLDAFVSGLAAGAVLSVLVLLFQLFDVHPFFSLRRGHLWELLGRYTAGFADPNAFGVAGGILVPLFLLSGRRRQVVSGLALLAVLPWSGSRTALLGLASWACIVLVRWLHCRRGWSLWTASSVLLLLCLIGGGLAGYPPVNDRLRSYSRTPAIERVLATLDWRSRSEMLESRMLYSRIALQVWRENPVTGVGLNRFFGRQVQAARSVGIDLGSWRDNANNFYLHTLAEQGILGLLLMLLGFASFAYALRGRAASYARARQVLPDPQKLLFITRTSLAVLVLLLITGPHVFFEEVRYLTAALLCFGTVSADGRSQAVLTGLRRCLFLLAALCPPVFVFLALYQAPHAVRGVYSREHSPDAGDYVWSGKRAIFYLCPRGKPAELEVQDGYPPDENNPLTVRFATAFQGKEETLHLGLPSQKWVVFRPPVSANAQGPVRIELECSRIWSPAAGNPEGDPRWLGIMIKWPDQICGAH